MANDAQKPTVREEPLTEADETLARASGAEQTVPPGLPGPPRGEQEQPEGVMAADAGEEGSPVPEEEFPWDKVVKWALTIAAITAVLYLIFRKKD